MPSHAIANPIPATMLPAGMVDRHQAARRFGVSLDQFQRWQVAGQVRCGRWVKAAGYPGGRRRVFPIDDLKKLVDKLRSQGELFGSELPDGYVDRDEAARILQIVPDTLALWFAA